MQKEQRNSFFVFKTRYHPDSEILTEYKSHYNRKLDRCFIHIWVFTVRGMTDEIHSEYLYDVLEGSADSDPKYAAFGIIQRKALDKSVICKVGDRVCHSEEEFKVLIKPYMEE